MVLRLPPGGCSGIPGDSGPAQALPWIRSPLPHAPQLPASPGVVADRQARRRARRPAGCRWGCSGPTMSLSEMPSRYFTSARICCRARRPAPLAAADGRRDGVVPVGAARHGVLQAFGQRHLGGAVSRSAVAALAARVARLASAGGGVSCCGARPAPARRRTGPSRPCSGPAARRSGARSGASLDHRQPGAVHLVSACHSGQIARLAPSVDDVELVALGLQQPAPPTAPARRRWA